MKKRKIWIIEDEGPYINIVRAALTVLEKEGGYSFDIESDEEFGLQQLSSKQRPDIVILDIYWQGRDPRGIAFYENLRKKYPKIPFVIVWSQFTGKEQADIYFRSAQALDNRLVILSSKAVENSFKETLKGCLERLEEEI